MSAAEFDPSEHTATEVQEHLATASPDEFARVKAAEAAEAGGKGRSTVLGYTQPQDSAVEPSSDGYTRRVVSS